MCIGSLGLLDSLVGRSHPGWSGPILKSETLPELGWWGETDRGREISGVLVSADFGDRNGHELETTSSFGTLKTQETRGHISLEPPLRSAVLKAEINPERWVLPGSSRTTGLQVACDC